MNGLKVVTAMFMAGVTMPAVGQGVMPPVPTARIEILAPTQRSHVLRPRCGPYRDSLLWNFDGRSARFTSVRLLGKSLSPRHLATLNRAAAALGDDLIIRVECNHAGVTLAMFSTNSVGSERVVRTDFDYDNDGLRRVD